MRLRVKDIDFKLNEIVVRDGKGRKDRVTIFTDEIKSELSDHLVYVKKIHEKDLRDGYGKVYLPNALERKNKNANSERGWQYVFPSKKLSDDPRSGKKRRHYIHLASLNHYISKAARTAGIIKYISSHAFIASQHTFSKTATIFERYSSFLDTRTLPP